MWDYFLRTQLYLRLGLSSNPFQTHPWDLRLYQSVILGLVIIISGFIGSLGNEVYLFAFLLVLTFSLFYAEKYFVAGLTAGLLFLTRGEGVLVLLIMIAFGLMSHYFRQKMVNITLVKPSLYLAAGFAIPVLIWFIYSSFVFGSFLPNTLEAKKAQVQTNLWQPFQVRLLKEWVPSWGAEFRLVDNTWLNIWWLTIIVGLVISALKRCKWLIFLAWIASYIVGYSILGVAGYYWYSLPVLFVAQLFFALGLISVIEWILTHIPAQVLAITVALCVVGISLFLMGKPKFYKILYDYTGDPRGPSYIQMSEWFNQNTLPSESIAYIEVGYLGFYTQNKIIDLAGLVTPDIVPHIAESDFTWGFWHYEPDYYVYLPDFDWALGEIKTNPQFEQLYQPVATLAGPRDADIVIYKRIIVEEMGLFGP